MAIKIRDWIRGSLKSIQIVLLPFQAIINCIIGSI